MGEETKDLLKIRNLNTCSLEQLIINGKHTDEAEKIAEATKQIIISRGSQVSEAHHKTLKEMAFVLLEDFQQADKAAVVPAECGIGKTTLIEAFLKYKLDTDEDFGAIVVKEQISDIRQLKSALNGKACGLYSFCSEECLNGLKNYSRITCKTCEKKCKMNLAKDNFKDYPVIIMSGEKLRMLMMYKGGINDFLNFNDANGKKNSHYRRKAAYCDQ
ncbi:MAG: hypothetical protein H6Q60_5 [Oscillospiraceae bacterium]|nr:hypothetical protein [Oscillospiraceae bacterium]